LACGVIDCWQGQPHRLLGGLLMAVLGGGMGLYFFRPMPFFWNLQVEVRSDGVTVRHGTRERFLAFADFQDVRRETLSVQNSPRAIHNCELVLNSGEKILFDSHLS